MLTILFKEVVINGGEFRGVDRIWDLVLEIVYIYIKCGHTWTSHKKKKRYRGEKAGSQSMGVNSPVEVSCT